MRSTPLAEFELLVMLAIARLEDNAYGVTIRREIESRAGRSVAIGAVYATLARLADKGYVTTSVSDPEPVRGGRARRLAHLTRGGWAVLRASTRMIERMLDGLTLAPAGGTRR